MPFIEYLQQNRQSLFIFMNKFYKTLLKADGLINVQVYNFYFLLKKWNLIFYFKLIFTLWDCHNLRNCWEFRFNFAFTVKNVLAKIFHKVLCL